MNGTSEKEGLGRRRFLKTAASTAAGLTVLPAGTVFGTQANSKLNLAITGCGGRGGFVGNLFEKHTNTKVIALHDYFSDRVNTVGEKLTVDPKRRFVGLNGYKELIADDVDAIAVMSPPYFHPDQIVDTLEAGKHLYSCKPLAVDVPSCKKILQAAMKAKGRLSQLVDFQTRNDPLFKEAARRVSDGAIGNPVLGPVYYQAGRLRVKATGDTHMARLLNWVFDIPLSGDIIVEQNIHVLDVANWYLDAHPLKAHGTGGRAARTDVGDCWDHFVVTFWYPDDVLVDFSSGQYLKGYDDLCIRVYGSEGTVDSHYGGPVKITGDHEWQGGDTGPIYTSGTINNIKDFHSSVVNDVPLFDTVEPSVTSNLTAILGRMAAYQHRTVTWEEMESSTERLDAQLSLPADGSTWKPSS
jgi:myo-inositol 2-dehydrogenase/D-chiro-inositol 1-dehydrogenase